MEQTKAQKPELPRITSIENQLSMAGYQLPVIKPTPQARSEYLISDS
jgi:hypothetical protein